MSNGKTILSESDFVDVIDAAGTITSVPEAWTKSGSRLLPPGTRKATAANIKAAEAKTSTAKGEKVDVDQIRADIEASIREEHEAALAERDERIVELEEQVEQLTAAADSKPGDDGTKDAKPEK